MDIGVVLQGDQTLDTAALVLVEVLGSDAFSLRVADGLVQLALDRWDDPAPRWGGAGIWRDDGASCTSGLYWQNPWWPNVPQIMSAGHCGPRFTQWQNNAGHWGGTTWNGLDNGGTARIDVSSIEPNGGGQGYFFVGPANGNGGVHVDFYYTQYQQGVTGIRTSGAQNGERFVPPGNVTGTDMTVNLNIGGQAHHVNRADCFVVLGDSGGPVFTVTPQGGIVAAGVILGRTSDTTCYYTPVKAIIDQFGGAPMG